MNSLYKTTQYDPKLDNEYKWVIAADYKKCSSYACRGHDETPKNRVRVQGRTITVTCSFCAKESQYTAREYIEERPCADCSYRRKVRVSIMSSTNGPGEGHARNLCRPCELDRSAATHIAQAKALHAKAEKLRAERRPNDDVEP